MTRLYVPMYTQSRLQASWAATPGLAKGTECVHSSVTFRCGHVAWRTGGRRYFARSMQTAVSIHALV